MTKITLTM